MIVHVERLDAKFQAVPLVESEFLKESQIPVTEACQ
jgi:hypothetical protein